MQMRPADPNFKVTDHIRVPFSFTPRMDSILLGRMIPSFLFARYKMYASICKSSEIKLN